MSRETEREKPNSASPQITIRMISSRSRARHFRCRWRRSKSLSARVRIHADDDNGESLINAPDQVLDPVGVRPKLLGKLVEVRIGYFLKAGLVHIGDDLHPHAFELPRGLLLELEGFRL